MKVEGYCYIGHHTVVVMRNVTVDGADEGLIAVERYRVTPAPDANHANVEEIINNAEGELTIVYEGHDFDLARRLYTVEAIHQLGEELVCIPR